MEAAGCEILYHMERIGVMGLDGLFEKLFDIIGIRRSLFKRFSEDKPIVFVGIDVPDFNLTLERKLKAQGVPCIHYVSPTVWAWRGYRIHKIRDSINHMLTLFPFEAAFYEARDVPVTFVGHPFADQIDAPDRTRARADLGLPEDATVVALLPGSRRSEVKRLAGLLVDSARDLAAQRPGIIFLLPFANKRVEKEFDEAVGQTNDISLIRLSGQARLALEASTTAILASGTVALEAAILRRPHVVVYKLSAFSYWLMRKLGQVNYYSMPNHLLPQPRVPELIQSAATRENVVREVSRFLDNPDLAADLERAFEEIHLQLRRDANIQARNAIARIAGLN